MLAEYKTDNTNTTQVLLGNNKIFTLLEENGQVVTDLRYVMIKERIIDYAVDLHNDTALYFLV